MNDYEKQAQDLLDKTKTTMTCKLLGHYKYFSDDKEARDVYSITLKRGEKSYTFDFGQSIVCSMGETTKRELAAIANRSNSVNPEVFDKKYRERKKQVKYPSAYDVLACIEKNDTGTHKDFCDNYGYDVDSRKGLEIYLKVQEQSEKIQWLFRDVMEGLQEIQ